MFHDGWGRQSRKTYPYATPLFRVVQPLIFFLSNCIRPSNVSGTHLMATSEDFSCLLKVLTKKEITSSLPNCTFTRVEKQTHAILEEAVGLLPDGLRSQVIEAAQVKKKKKELHTSGTEYVPLLKSRPADGSTFMKLALGRLSKRSHDKVDQSTGNNATSMSVCACCAGRFWSTDVQEVTVSDLQDKDKLTPSIPHPAHQTHQGHATPLFTSFLFRTVMVYLLSTSVILV